jgi:hypothetical protein
LRLNELFETSLSIVNDSGKPKILGKLKVSGKFFKKSPDRNIEIGRLHKIVEEVLEMISRNYSITKIKYMKFFAEKGLKSIYSLDALKLALDLYEAYQFAEQYPNEISYQVLQTILGNEIVILNIGKSSSGKSAGIKSLTAKEYWTIFEIIVGIRETSTFENEYHLVTDPLVIKRLPGIIDHDVFSVRPTFKTAKKVSELIHGNVANFVQRCNRAVFEAIIVNSIEEIDWVKMVSECFPAFTNDEDRIFNLELLLGKIDFDKPVFNELLEMLYSLLIQIEKIRLKKQSELFIDETSILNNKIKTIREMYLLIKDKDDLLDELIMESNQILQEHPVLDSIELLLFNEIIRAVTTSLPWTTGQQLLNSGKASLDEIKMIYDRIIHPNEQESFIKFQLPSKSLGINENRQIRGETSRRLKSFYANAKQVKKDEMFLSPMVEKMEVWLPYNDRFEKLGINIKMVDTIGLDHGDNITPIKLGNRTLNYINIYNPDLIFLNVNLTEKQDQLQFVMENITHSGYFEKTFILGGHADELTLDIAKKEYLEPMSHDVDYEQLSLSDNAKQEIEDAFGDLPSVFSNLDKTDQNHILAYLIANNLDEILENIWERYIEEPINTAIKINYNSIKNRVFLIDKLDNLTSMIGNNSLSLVHVQEKLLHQIKTVAAITAKAVELGQKNVTLNFKMNYLQKVIHNILNEYYQYEKELFGKNNLDLRWNTIDRALAELKEDRPGQYNGTSYDITPGFDFAAIFNRGIMSKNNENQLFELQINSLADDDLTLITDRFKSYFSRILYELAHLTFVTNHVTRYEEIYQVRGGRRLYFSIPMTSERKIRMIQLLKGICDDREQIEVLIRLSLEGAKDELFSNDKR